LSQNPELCRKALELIPETPSGEGLAILGLRQYWLMEGGIRPFQAIKLYNEAIETGQKIGNVFVGVLAWHRLAEAFV
jgi:hypothetical protein